MERPQRDQQAARRAQQDKAHEAAAARRGRGRRHPAAVGEQHRQVLVLRQLEGALQGRPKAWVQLGGAPECRERVVAPAQSGQRERAVVVDVGETEEFALGHINGARNIPLNQLEQRLASEVKNKTLPLILVDQSGSRAARALAMAKGLGYDKAVVLGGGLKAWKEANLPLERA